MSLAVAIAAAALTACIIGPKQDDPTPSAIAADTGTAVEDTTTGGMDGAEDIDGGKTGVDAVPPPSDTMAAPSDAGCVAPDADGGDACVTDASSDARDGG